jgi:hypothetical protein
MLSHEDGPWDVFARMRRKLGNGTLHRLFGCFYCLSLWVAVPLAVFVRGDAGETVVGWLALSAAAILLERVAREPLELKIEEAEKWDVVAKR